MIKGKFIFSGILFLCLTFVLNAAEVKKKTAAKVAINYFFEVAGNVKGLNPEEISINDSYTYKVNNNAVYYIFSFKKNGFVIVAADDIVEPVLGYSIYNSYDPDNI